MSSDRYRSETPYTLSKDLEFRKENDPKNSLKKSSERENGSLQFITENYQRIPGELPPGWKSATDQFGRIYYYHSIKRVPQWNTPEWPEPDELIKRDEKESFNSKNSNLTSDGNKTNTFAQQKHFLSLISSMNNTFQSNESKKQKDQTNQLKSFNPQTIEMGGQSIEVPPIDKDYENIRTDQDIQIKPYTIEDSDTPRKNWNCKANQEYKVELSLCVRKSLEKYYSTQCKQGRITSKEDFKRLARKLTHVLIEKHLKTEKILSWTKEIEQKTIKWIHHHMQQYHSVYK